MTTALCGGSYFVLHLNGVANSFENEISDLCFSSGAQGISETLSFRQESLNYEAETICTDVHDLKVYFSHSPSPDWIESFKAQFPSVEMFLIQEKERDWLEEWKKGFEPFCLAADWWVVPSWREAPSEAQKIIRLDPGMAFGTGTHETTRLAAEMMSEINLFNRSVLDVGTGTGLLAMAAARGGATTVRGMDIDPVARKVAEENIKNNHLDSLIQILPGELHEVEGVFDVVVANIIDGVLVKLKDILMTRVKEAGGYLILSGILREHEQRFCQEFHWQQLSQWVCKKKKTQGDWVSFLLQRG